MPTGHYARKPRVARVEIVCPQCGSSRFYTPGFMAQHPTIRFCSKRCAGLAAVKPGSYITASCRACGVEFKRRADLAARRKNLFCSKRCAGDFRKVEGAKWRDPEQIREYMRAYTVANRKRLNAEKARYKRENRGMANEIQRKRRGDGGDFTAEHWALILAVAPFCLNCGSSDALEPDHVIALASGGKNDASNIQPLCRSCNARKGKKTFDFRSDRLKKKLVEACYPQLRITEL